MSSKYAQSKKYAQSNISLWSTGPWYDAPTGGSVTTAPGNGDEVDYNGFSVRLPSLINFNLTLSGTAAFGGYTSALGGGTTNTGTLTVNKGIMNFGNSFFNQGTIINNGTIYNPSASIFNNSGIIVNNGIIDTAGGSFVNGNGSSIDNTNGKIIFLSSVGTLVSGPSSQIELSATTYNYASSVGGGIIGG